MMAGLLLVAVVTVVAGPVPALAQEVRVTIRTVSDAVAVEGARVTIGEMGALTDTAGEAILRLPRGEHRVRVSRLGYLDADASLTLLTSADTTLTIELVAEAIETEGIVVMSTRAGRRIEDEPLRVEVVSREEVEEKLLMTPGDIAMLLNETAGLRVQPTAPSLGGATVRIQGLRGRYTQILSDGLPLYGGQAGALGPLQIPPMDLEQVEVIKGAASALYGSTALGGVVNLISRSPEPERELLLNQSTLGGTDAIGWVADELNERWGYTLLASGHRQGRADVDDDGWADLPGFRRGLVRPRVFWDDGRGVSVFGTLGAMVEDRRGGTLPGATTPAGTTFTEQLDTRRLDAGVVGRVRLSDSRYLSVRGSAMAQRHRHAFGASIERDLHGTGFAELALSGSDGSHTWVLGGAMQHDRYDARDVPGFDFRHTVPALFAQDEYVVTPWLTLSASARLDRHSEYGVFLNPRLSVLLRPSEWTVRLSAGTGYFAPTPFVEQTEAVGLGRLDPFDGLSAERARSTMIDVGRTLGSWELNGSVFASEVDDALVAVANGMDGLSLLNSPGPVRTWGTELLARYHQGPIHVTATHVHLRSTELDPVGTERREVPLNPRHAVGIVGAWEDEEWGRAGIELYYTGRQELDDNPYRVASERYLVVGFLVEHRVGRARIFLNAENLLDTRQTRHDSLVRPARTPDGRWITDVWAPLEGRSFNGGVRWAF
jgi:iron complex outermembrane receptor protein